MRDRLDQHQKEKDFWTRAVVFTAKDNSLNKAHVRYLEARLIELATEAKVAVLDNGNAPPARDLGEAEVADMESYLDEILLFLPLVNVGVFDVVRVESEAIAAASSTHEPDTVRLESDGLPYFLSAQLTSAEARDGARGFVVLDGALGRAATKVMNPAYRQLRQQLIDEGVLIPHGNDQIRLTKNYVFNSPSSAASVLTGGSKNGRTEWKDRNGNTLKQNQAASTETS
ncbi:GIY-YIG nuclease family protein [Frankia sp. CN7]|uniref:GIY-YIG nuclease family protein n=1 Tax=Frankia nepalensis TaxID=1836974 RepID=UPI001934795C|nr:GIY-YIG nuclease family protein [Frankia nepalensis]MBL7500511.1 GIY-YIG nuclease family protein [Frankia nepalensis]